MKYRPINPDLFRLNRRRFERQMKPRCLAIFHSNDAMPRNGDQSFPFRQNSHLFGLCGIDQEETILVLFPDCIKEEMKTILFIKRTDKKTALYDGQLLSKEEARGISGVHKVLWADEFESALHALIHSSEGIYINSNEHDNFSTPVQSKDLRQAQILKARYPLHQYHRAQPILRNMAMIKSPIEVGLIQQAVDITHKAFQRVLDFVKPGVMEYEIEAEIIHEFIRNRANGHAYSPIVASGKNSCILHYNQNNKKCQDGELLLLDFGAEYANYAADLSRTIPVSGQFSPRQRAVYQAVLRVMQKASSWLVPGTSLQEYQEEVGKLMESELIGLKLLDQTDIKNQNPEQPAYKKYFMHGTSHHIGLDVHDLSNRHIPLQAGMVFTVEPAIYIPEEGFGIRIENNIQVTDQGPVDLTAKVPVEFQEIEEIMNAGVLH